MAPGIVTDSASALSAATCRRLGIQLVQLRVVIDNQDTADGDVDHDLLYQAIAGGREVSTSQPSPGDILEAYRRAAAGGAELAWSIHVGSAVSGTVQAASLAAAEAALPVRSLDTGLASMAEGLCVLAAVDALGRDPGADLGAVVEAEARLQENVFITLDPAALSRGGRLAGVPSTGAITVLALRHGQSVEAIGSAADISYALQQLAQSVDDLDPAAVVAVGGGGCPAEMDELWRRVVARVDARRVVRYRVPASIAAHVGPSVGLVISGRGIPAGLLAAVGA